MRIGKPAALGLALGLGLGGPATAAQIGYFQSDATFNALCALGAAVGTGNQACEFAVGELRAGNGGLNGDWEVGIQSPPGSPRNVQEFVHVSGRAEPFELRYDAGLRVLSLVHGLGGATQTTSAAAVPSGLSGMRSMFIRIRDQRDAADRPGTIELRDLALTAGAVTALIDPLATTAAGSDFAAYALISGMDFGGDWVLSGTSTFAWSAVYPGGSRLNVNFKLTDYAPPPAVPVPAAAGLLAGALAVLAMVGRRRRG